MQGKKLFSYFLQWRLVRDEYNAKLHTLVKSRIIKHYVSMMDSYFSRWQESINFESKKKRRHVVSDITTENE